jgi:hypothetical protein
MAERVLIAILLMIVAIFISVMIFRSNPSPFKGRSRTVIIAIDIILGSVLLIGCIVFTVLFSQAP